jgi:hypothetical protein
VTLVADWQGLSPAMCRRSRPFLISQDRSFKQPLDRLGTLCLLVPGSAGFNGPRFPAGKYPLCSTRSTGRLLRVGLQTSPAGNIKHDAAGQTIYKEGRYA